ncbi:hypothetical protein [Streptomyces sp. OM5714]|uniref:hypothetical protein n=1 Tax=Streptomyces sp. OM5714 TaxID=2602736 RepID=UPI0013D9AE71|nr:hypothetical protein [Streptomyces sp. OM5714]
MPTAPTPRRQALYENWKPPVVAVCLLLPVEADCLAVADLNGMLTLPVGTVDDRQALEQAARAVVSGAPAPLQNLRRVAFHKVQTRRRKVVTHVLAAATMTHDTVTSLRYRDPRAILEIMPTRHFLDRASPPTRTRTLTALQTLTTGTTAHLIHKYPAQGPIPAPWCPVTSL